MKPSFNTLLHGLINPASGLAMDWPMLSFDPRFVPVVETATEAAVRTALGLHDGTMCHAYPLLLLLTTHDSVREAFPRDAIYDLGLYQPTYFSTVVESPDCAVSPGADDMVWPFPAIVGPLSRYLRVTRVGPQSLRYSWGEFGRQELLTATFDTDDTVAKVRNAAGQEIVRLTREVESPWEVGSTIAFESFPPNYPADDFLEQVLRVDGVFDLLEQANLQGLFGVTVRPQVKLAAIAGALAIVTAARF